MRGINSNKAFKIQNLVLLMLCITGAAEASRSKAGTPNHNLLVNWRGESLKHSEGAVYLSLGFKSGSGVQAASGRVDILLRSLPELKNFVFSNTVSSIDGQYHELWKLPAGKYRLEKFEFFDQNSKKRQWLGGPQYAEFIVKSQHLSNLGQWTISQLNDGLLTLKLAEQKNLFREARPKPDSSIVAVIEGRSGRIQEVFAGGRLTAAESYSPSTSDQLRVSVATSRQVSMYMALQLDKDSAFIRQTVNALAVFDPTLRSCYTRRIDEVGKNAAMRGNMVFRIMISERTGTIQDIQRTSGTLNDEDLADCLIQELTRISLPADKPAKGELKLTFDVK